MFSHWKPKSVASDFAFGSASMRRTCASSFAGLLEFARIASAEQFVVGNAAPQEEGQARGELDIRQRVCVACIAAAFDAIQEVRAREDRRQRIAHAGIESAGLRSRCRRTPCSGCSISSVTGRRNARCARLLMIFCAQAVSSETCLRLADENLLPRRRTARSLRSSSGRGSAGRSGRPDAPRRLPADRTGKRSSLSMFARLRKVTATRCCPAGALKRMSRSRALMASTRLFLRLVDGLLVALAAHVGADRTPCHPAARSRCC